MNTWCYTREPGTEGNIITGEGDGPGATVEALLERERPPLKAAFEIGSAVADLLCISLEDGQVHGDIQPVSIRVDQRGAVSVDGWGVLRRTNSFPEGVGDRPEADVYGLGLLLHAVLSERPPGPLPRDPDAHDETVVDRAVALELGAVAGKRWVDELRSFLCACLAWNPKERPAPLDVANVLALAASQTPGEGLASWARRASSDAPRSRPAAPVAPPPVRDDREQLGGAVSISVPIKRGAARQAPSSKGASTAAWTKEKLAAMYADEDQEFLEEMEARKRQSPPEIRRVAIPSPPDPPPPRVAPPVSPPRAETRPQRTDVATVDIRGPSAAAEPAEPAGRSNIGLIVGGIIAAIVLCSGVVTLLGGAGYIYSLAGGTPSETTDEKAKTDEPKTDETKTGETKTDEPKTGEAKTGETKTDETKTDETKTSGTTSVSSAASASPSSSSSASKSGSTSSGSTGSTSSGSTSSASKSSTGSSSAKTSSSTAAPPATKTTTTTTTTTATTSKTSTGEPNFSSYQVRFSANGGEAKVQCGDGQTAEFAGSTSLTFVGTQTCRVRIGRGQGAVQVSRGGTVTCSDDNGKVTCTGP